MLLVGKNDLEEKDTCEGYPFYSHLHTCGRLRGGESLYRQARAAGIITVGSEEYRLANL